MQLNYKLTKEDYIALNLYYNMEHSPIMKKVIFIARFFVPGIFFLILSVYANSTKVSFWQVMVACFVMSILWITFFKKYLEMIIKIRISMAIDEGKNVGLIGNKNLYLTEEGITIISETKQLKTSWRAVDRICDTNKHIFIFINYAEAYIIPKSAFENENIKNEFLAELNTRKG